MTQATLWQVRTTPLPTREERDALTTQLISIVETNVADWAERTFAPRHITAVWENDHGVHAGFSVNPESGDAAYAVTRRKDGTLTQRIHGETVDGAPIGWPAGIGLAANRKLENETAERLVATVGTGRIAAALADHQNHARLSAAIGHTVRQAAKKKAEGHTDLTALAGAAAPHGPDTHPRQSLNLLIRERILDGPTAKAARKKHKLRSAMPSPEEYNAALGSRNTGNNPKATPTDNRTPTTQQINEAANAALEDTPWWSPLALVDENGTLRLEAMANEANPPEFTCYRAPDGTITINPGARRPGPRLNFNGNTPALRPVIQANELIIGYLLNRSSQPGALLMADPYSRNWTDQARKAAEVNMNLRLLPCRTGSTPKGGTTTVTKLPSLITTVIRKNLADARIIRHADQLPTPVKSYWKLALYNNLILNRQATADVETTNPSAARYFTENVIPSKEEEKTLSPAEIVAAVRDHLQLPKNLWKWFTKLRGCWESTPGHPVTPRDLKALCSLLQAANVPEPDTGKLRIIGGMRHVHNQMERTDELQKAWTRTVNRYLTLEQPYHGLQRNTLVHLADAIHQVEGRWGPGTWEEMCRRADVILERGPGQKAAPKVSWTNAVGVTECQGHVFTPLDSNWDLDRWGDALANCLGNYTDRCQRGADRIFVAAGPDGETAVVQLHDDGARWAPVQIEGPGRSLTSAALKDAATELAEIYQRADHAQPEEG